ncbi:hypothetical protein OG836_13580 [Micromonospora zamorensis]|uniref:hypothetical protein n=1 Tax=Micromonospora zamorensis TaxID=709883 RepID=UPI002E23282E
MASQATAVWQTMVSPSYQTFWFHDPTCEESQNAATALLASQREVVGWAPNAVMVQVTTDLVSMAVSIEALDGPPDPDDAADLARDGQLKMPGGVLSIPKSDDETLQTGVDLPAGPGTYGVRVYGYGRTRAKRLRDEAPGRGLPGEMDSLVEALTGVERYRISLWQVSSEPRWDDEDD